MNVIIQAEARAIEVDAGESLPDIRTALAEVKSGNVGRVTTPEQILLRQARAKTGVVCLLRLIVNHPELTQELSANE